MISKRMCVNATVFHGTKILIGNGKKIQAFLKLHLENGGWNYFRCKNQFRKNDCKGPMLRSQDISGPQNLRSQRIYLHIPEFECLGYPPNTYIVNETKKKKNIPKSNHVLLIFIYNYSPNFIYSLHFQVIYVIPYISIYFIYSLIINISSPGVCLLECLIYILGCPPSQYLWQMKVYRDPLLKM